MNYARITVLLSKSKTNQPVHGLHMVRHVLANHTKENVRLTKSHMNTFNSTLRYPTLLFVCLIVIAALTDTCTHLATTNPTDGSPKPDANNTALQHKVDPARLPVTQHLCPVISLTIVGQLMAGGPVQVVMPP